MRLIGQLNRLLWGLNLALVAGALFVVVVSLASGPSERHVPPTTSSAGTLTAPRAGGSETRDSIDPKLILERDIFGAGLGATGGPGKADASVSGQAKAEIKRELPLRLLGTVVDEKHASYAVLENLTTKAQDIYRVGDAIGEVRIDSIEQNKIVVVNMGVRETLNIALTARDVPATVVASQTPPPEPAKAGPDEVMKVVSGSERQINTSASMESLDRAAQFLSKLKVSPHVTDGREDGLRISGLGDSAMAQLVGLRDGDVIRSINGHPVPNPRKAFEVLRTARKLGYARIELKRGQETETLAFNAGSW